MKLNKVLALALSGIMAVSMLAGCSNNTNGGKDEQVPATGIVAAVNNGQSADNKVKITFTADATLDSSLNKAIIAAGEDANFDAVQVKLMPMLKDAVAVTTSDIAQTLNTKKVGKVTGVEVFSINGLYSEEAAEKEAAKSIDAMIATLKENTVTGNTKVGDTYYKYDYTGSVSMVKASKNDGTTTYFVAVAITSNTTKATVTV